MHPETHSVAYLVECMETKWKLIQKGTNIGGENKGSPSENAVVMILLDIHQHRKTLDGSVHRDAGTVKTMFRER